MPVKPGIAKDLIEADDIGRKAVADFIDSLLVKKDWPCSAAHNIDVNAITTEHNSFYCHLHGSGGISIQPGTKGRACWFCH